MDAPDSTQENQLLTHIVDLIRIVVFYPSEVISILYQISYTPVEKQGSTAVNKLDYLRDIYVQEGVWGFSRGLLAHILNYYLYTMVWRTVNRGSEQHLALVFGQQILSDDYPSQLNVGLRLTRLLMSDTAAALSTHPVHVVQTRQVAQYVGKETNYSTIVTGLIYTFSANGICGYFYGLLPRLLSIVIVDSLTEISDWIVDVLSDQLSRNPPTNPSVTEHYIIHHRDKSKNITKRISRLIGMLLCGGCDKVITNMEVDNSCLQASKVESRANYQSWFNFGYNKLCYVPSKCNH